MPITLENISARPSRQTLKIKGIGTRDTMQYLSALGGTYQDAIFNEQTSNLPDEYIRLDEMASDEKQYNLNIYEFFLNQHLNLYAKKLKQRWIFII